MKKILTILFVSFITNLAFGQTGLRGTVTDDIGEPIIAGTVLVENTGGGTITEIDGTYSLELEPGIYTVSFSYLGYVTIKVEGVEITDGIKILDMSLKEDVETIGEIVVEADAIETTDAALLNKKKSSAVLLDGVSKKTFALTGDNSASQAMQRVTGVSVQGGKYVFVRGLGDRYTKTILNSMDIPGLDPDRNSIQMDIFPTNLIDNIYVLKSFSPDLPGDFTGGIININTKAFPEEKTMNISAGIGYNPAMNLNSNFLSYEGGSTDFLGFDDGTRDLKVSNNLTIPNPASRNSLLTTVTDAFSKNLAATQQTSPINANFSFSMGNQVKRGEVKLGYNAALNYRNTTTYFEDVEFNQYQKESQLDRFELQRNRVQTGSIGKNNVLLSGLIGGAAQWKGNMISLSAMHLQNGEKTAAFFNQETFIDGVNEIVRDNLEYNQRSLSNALLRGEHNFGKLDSKAYRYKVEWKVAPTYSSLQDKDIRLTAFRVENNVFSIEPSEGEAQPRRIFRSLDEINLSNRLDFTTNLNGSTTKKNELKIGGSYNYKQRDYRIDNYRFDLRGTAAVPINGDPDLVLIEQNIWTPETDAGIFAIGNPEPANTFDAQQRILGLYAMNDVELGEKARLVWGARTENFQHIYTGINQAGDSLNNEEVINSWKFFPSVNFVYTIKEVEVDNGANRTMNLRLSYNRTVARPSFKEASGAQIYDALTDRTFIGNLGVIETDIDNFDLRWEYYLGTGEMVSASVFYKRFTNPIELLAFKPQTPNDFTPRNVGDGTVLGLELEVRKNLEFISPSLKNFEIGTNLTLVDSELQMDSTEVASREGVARIGETVGTTRQMQGQSPYIINVILNYLNRENGWEGNISYNVQGPALFIVGIGANADVFNQPFHSLNVKVSKAFGQEQKTRVGLKVSNILDAERLKLYQSFSAADQVFERFIPGRTFSLSVNHRIN